MNIPLNEEVIFSFGEFASYGAAISTLAEELREYASTVMNKQDREGLSRVMMALSSGSVVVGPYTIEWRRSETSKSDIYYTIKS